LKSSFAIALVPLLVTAGADCSAASTLEHSAAPAFKDKTWHWVAAELDRRSLVVRLVHGSVRIIRRPGPVEIEFNARSKTQDPRAVTFVITAEGRRIVVSDRYPSANPFDFRECLPPTDARGDIWHSDILVDGLIFAPADIPVTTEIMDLQPSVSPHSRRDLCIRRALVGPRQGLQLCLNHIRDLGERAKVWRAQA
jgi:hypothetical protein